MYNYFLQNPIKINILTIEIEEIKINHKIIFLGNITSKIKNNILKFNKTTSPSILKKYYGSMWNNKLELVNDKLGGDVNISSEDLINFDDFNLSSLNEKIDEKIETIDTMIIESKNINNIIKKKSNIIYNEDIFIYPEDNIKILREKIYLATNIHIYEQNISLFNYTIFIDKLKYDISFNNIFNFHKIKNIPIDSYLYENRDNILIYGNEYEYLYTYFKEDDKLDINVLSISEFIKDKSDLQRIVSTDKQQTDMIYYSFILKYFPLITYDVFKNYILYNDDMKNIYSTLHLDYQEIQNKYNLEKKILLKNESIDKDVYKKFIEKEFTSSIIEREFIIKSVNKLNKINIRNLFDNIEISTITNVNYIKANIYIDNKDILLTKINNKTTNIKEDVIEINSILFNINIIYKKFNIYEEDDVFMSLIINELGDISLKVLFKDLYEINNKKIYEIINEIINPIIININKKLIKTDNHLSIITEYNNIIKNSIIHIFWNNEISIKGFNVLLLKIKDYIHAGIINIKTENLINNEIEYGINRGMITFNEKAINRYTSTNSNYYSYYSNGEIKVFWNRIYNNSKTLLIKNKLNNLKLELNNITELELEYISQLLYKFL